MQILELAKALVKFTTLLCVGFMFSNLLFISSFFALLLTVGIWFVAVFETQVFQLTPKFICC
jgi:hypothetical protein